MILIKYKSKLAMFHKNKNIEQQQSSGLLRSISVSQNKCSCNNGSMKSVKADKHLMLLTEKDITPIVFTRIRCLQTKSVDSLSWTNILLFVKCIQFLEFSYSVIIREMSLEALLLLDLNF